MSPRARRFLAACAALALVGAALPLYLAAPPPCGDLALCGGCLLAALAVFAPRG